MLGDSRSNTEALKLLAEICSSRGQFRKAAEYLRRVTGLMPQDAAALRLLGDALFAAGDYRAAAESLSRALALDPNSARACNNIGRSLARLGRRAEAIASYRRALELDPRYAIAHNNLGTALVEDGRPQEALRCYDSAIQLDPRFAEAHGNRGNVLLQLNRVQEAVDSLDLASNLKPDNATILCNRGNALLRAKRHQQALDCHNRALRLQPDFPEALTGRGNILRELRRYDEAMGDYERVLALQPQHAEAGVNRALTLLELGRCEQAIACCDELLDVHPDNASALMYRAIALNFLYRHREAIEGFSRLYAADPTALYSLGYLLETNAMIYDWSHRHLIADGLRAVANGIPIVSPLAMLGITDAGSAQLDCARLCVKTTHPPACAPIWAGERWARPKIRVAYLSADFRDHAVSYLLVGVLEQHDRTRFEPLGISFRPPEATAFGHRIARAFDAFVDVYGQSDYGVAMLLRDMQVDIAVDLMGFTRDQRLNVFAHRPAPVQVNYLGYPGTMGAPYIDYIIADDFVIPHHSRKHYAEQVVCLPECFQANDDRRAIASHRPSRSDVGLPEAAAVLCSFNNSYKITPIMFDIWCRVLNAAPDTVLWILADTQQGRENLLREAAMRGVGAARVVFAARLPYEQHLARLGLADLFLDTLPFNAGTTASDALWAGVPVLTCCGEAFASRMAGSLLRAIGLPDLITESLAAYERIALELAASPARLAQLRQRLELNRTSSPLFMTGRFCRHLESAYEAMHERSQRGEAPASFEVAALPTPRAC